MTTWGFTSDTYNFTSTMDCGELTITYNDVRDVQNFDLWTNETAVYDKGLDSKNITLTGYEKTGASGGGPPVSPFTLMGYIDDVMDAGDVITTFGLKNSDLNTTWLIESFTYDFITSNLVQWSLTLEKYY